MSFKVCSKCGVGKPATTDFFHQHKDSSDGLRNVCKSCRNKYQKKYRFNPKNLESIWLCKQCYKDLQVILNNLKKEN